MPFRTKSSSPSPAAAAASRPKRDLDLIVFGATGFTGRIVAEHLARDYSSPSRSSRPVVRYALAGRDAARLAKARDEVASHAPAAADAELVAVDVERHDELVALFSRARAVVSTAGPYSLYGTPIVKACVDAGTHYCDITGELSWVASLRGGKGDDGDDDLDAKAKAKGVKLVPCCGYDCVPSDLGAFMVAEELKKRLSRGGKKLRVAKVETAVDGSKMEGGGVSGGTAASALNLVSDPKASELNSDPYVCFPSAEAEKWKGKGTASARPYPPLRLFRRRPALAAAPSSSSAKDDDGNESDASGWAVSWPLGGGNVAVVRRSAALLGYGKAKAPSAASDSSSDDDEVEVDVDETIEFPSLKLAMIFDAGLACVGAALFAAKRSSRARRWVESKVPRPGQGPTREKMLDAPWRHVVVATAAADETPSPLPPMTVRGVVGGPQDRGYYMTARMVLEAGLALAFEAKEEEGEKQKNVVSSSSGVFRSPPRSGILTPASALGNTLIDRLRNAGFTFEIEK